MHGAWAPHALAESRFHFSTLACTNMGGERTAIAWPRHNLILRLLYDQDEVGMISKRKRKGGHDGMMERRRCDVLAGTAVEVEAAIQYSR